MSTPMPSQLTNLLLVLRPASMRNRYTIRLRNLLTVLPQELATLFPNCLASTLDVVRATLPPALTSPPPENLALSPDFRMEVTKLTSVLTILLGITLTAFKLCVQDNVIIFRLFNAMNIGLYVNPSLNLPGLLHSMLNGLQSIYGESRRSRPYRTLTKLPHELFCILNNTPPSILHPLSVDMDKELFDLVTIVVIDLIELNRKLVDHLDDSPAAPGDHFEEVTVQNVHQAREGTNTNPDKCSGCLEGIRGGDNARRLGCLHNFHMGCIDRWLNTNKICPICRTHISDTH